MNSEFIVNIVNKHGFIECGEIAIFLSCLVNVNPDRESLRWVLVRLNECLANHDNGHDYFLKLRNLRDEIDNYICDGLCVE